MTASARLALVLGGLALVVAAGAAGFAVGAARAPDASDARLARQDAYRAAYAAALGTARRIRRDSALKAAVVRGRAAGRRTGASRGAGAGQRASDKKLAAIAVQSQIAAPTPQPAATGPLTQLPDGQPGYVLPPEQRTLGCVGINAETGQCVGD